MIKTTTKNIKQNISKLKLSIPLIEIKGFYPYESREDILSFFSNITNNNSNNNNNNNSNTNNIITNDKLDSILYSNTMLPTGKWLLKFNNYDEFQNVKKQLNYLSYNHSRITYRSIVEESKLFELQTTSKFGIDSKTILAYDISPLVDTEEFSYTLEEFDLDQKGIRKITADKSSISFLIHFVSRSEAERALFQLNGSSFTGTNLHLHLYT